MKYDYKTLADYPLEYCCKNNVITDVDVVVTGHFADSVSLVMYCENICPLPLCNSTKNIGFIIQHLMDCFDIIKDDSKSIKELENTSIRIIYNGPNAWAAKAVAIGHFMKDKFIDIEDLMREGLENE